MKANIHSLTYLAHFFLAWEIFQMKFVDEFKTHISSSDLFPNIMPFVR